MGLDHRCGLFGEERGAIVGVVPVRCTGGRERGEGTAALVGRGLSFQQEGFNVCGGGHLKQDPMADEPNVVRNRFQ